MAPDNNLDFSPELHFVQKKQWSVTQVKIEPAFLHTSDEKTKKTAADGDRLVLTYLLGTFSALLLTRRLAGAVLLHSRPIISACQPKYTHTNTYTHVHTPQIFFFSFVIAERSKLQ